MIFYKLNKAHYHVDSTSTMHYAKDTFTFFSINIDGVWYRHYISKFKGHISKRLIKKIIDGYRS